MATSLSILTRVGFLFYDTVSPPLSVFSAFPLHRAAVQPCGYLFFQSLLLCSGAARMFGMNPVHHVYHDLPAFLPFLFGVPDQDFLSQPTHVRAVLPPCSTRADAADPLPCTSSLFCTHTCQHLNPFALHSVIPAFRFPLFSPIPPFSRASRRIPRPPVSIPLWGDSPNSTRPLSCPPTVWTNGSCSHVLPDFPPPF